MVWGSANRFHLKIIDIKIKETSIFGNFFFYLHALYMALVPHQVSFYINFCCMETVRTYFGTHMLNEHK